MAWKNDSGHFIYYIIKFFSLCVGNVDYEYVKDELSNIAINYTLLEKVFDIMVSKLKDMKMSEQYIDRFKHAFQENMLKVIPKTIIEKVGNISNLRNIVLRTMEILYLE